MSVTIPDDSIQASAIVGGPAPAPSDLLAPLKDLLTGVGVLPADADLAANNSTWWIKGTPPSVAILESGATALSKGWTAIVGAIGGGAAITATATDLWKKDLTGASRVAAVGGVGLVIVSALLAIAYMVVGDIRGRTAGAVALYEARQAIALKFLEDTFSASSAARVVAARPAPTLAAVVPGWAGPAGEATVAVLGTGLTGATAVAFGANAVEGFQVLGDTCVAANVPAGTPNSETDITVTLASGDILWLRHAFRYTG